MSADPVKLVGILYRAAIESTAAARRHLAAGNIRERSRQIVRAWGILQELSRSLDPKAGGQVVVALAQLYPYMQARLIDANIRQIDPPLAQVEQLLVTLLEGWSSVSLPPAETAEDYESVSRTY
jgi:flagellar protein FliS